MSPILFDTVIMRLPSFGTPHLSALLASNPGLPIHFHDCPESSDPLLWRNGDRNIRDFWKLCSNATTSDWIIFLEADVYCNTSLADAIRIPTIGTGLAASRIFHCGRDRRAFLPFAEIPRLPRDMQAIAAGLMPLGVVLIHRHALDSLCDPSLDAVFASDIFSELRLPTVIQSLGYSLASLNLPFCDTIPKSPGLLPGIYHPVKSSVPSVPSVP